MDRWLLFNWSQNRNSILADEMGLGKTIQAAAFLQLLKRYQSRRGPFLIVAPLSTVTNWQREIFAWTDMDCIVYHGSQEDRELIREYEFYYSDSYGKGSNVGGVNKKRNSNSVHKIEIVITTPEMCCASDTRGPKSTRKLSKIFWDLIIIDEAHKIKNNDAKMTMILREDYSYHNCVLLTGTPLQNNTRELWTLLNFIDGDNFNDKV